MIDKQAGWHARIVTITLAVMAVPAVLSAGEVPPSGISATATKVLHFPQDHSVGVVYVQDENLVIPETVKGFHPGHVYAARENFCPARGEVHIPGGRRVILTIRGVGATPARCRTALESLRPDDLYGLEFFSMYPVDLSPDRIYQDNKGLDLSGLRNLRVLAINMSSKVTRVGEEIVRASDAFQDSDLACLSGLTELESLSLGGPGVGDEGMKYLASLPRLKYLTIGGGSNLTDAGLRHLVNLRRLDSLHIGNSRITDRGLEHLYPLKTLHILQIATTVPIRGQAVIRLRTELPHLQALDLSPPQPARRPAPPKPGIQPRAK